MDPSSASEGIGPLGVGWLVVLFVGIVYWAFRSQSRRRRGSDVRRPPEDDGGEG